MKTPEKMIIYNLFPLLAGPFSAWEKHFVRISQMRFNWIFVNPIQKTGRSNSLYAVGDHYSINPLLIDRETKKAAQMQVKGMIGVAEKMGLKMMVDLVVNHCSVDSDLINKHPEWFLWERTGRIAHPFAMDDGRKVVWEDLAKFDHQNTQDKEGLFQYFLNVVKYLRGLGFRGFRCDAAYQIPGSFWGRLIGETKAIHPDILFFAETLGCTADQTGETARSGFDYIFNSSKWWDFKSPWLLAQYNLTREVVPSISFPESHDTVRLSEELHGNIDGLKQRYLFSALFSAGVMIPMGFEFGFRKKLDVSKTRPEDWEKTNIDLTSFIGEVNRIKEAHTIFQEEAPTQILYGSNPNVLIMWKASVRTKEEALLILNKDIYARQPFSAGSLYEFVQAREPLVDVSPEYQLDYLPTPFSYDLRPGQGIVLITKRSP
jgi:starch synthase (maltosyl-transferring)